MVGRIEDYGLIGNAYTAALVGRDGSIDWLCLPRFDSAACFAALLGDADNGRWLLAPADPVLRSSRCYRDGTVILETKFETATGAVTVIDFMPVPDSEQEVDLFRLVRGDEGVVNMGMEILLRFDYGRIVPWVRRRDYGLSAVAGPDQVRLRTPVPLRGEGFTTRSDFVVRAGEVVPFALTWHPSHHHSFHYREPLEMLAATEAGWRVWSARCTLQGRWREPVLRSLITLKLLTYRPTGGIVAAPTTSLPERIKSVRNWDYRYCWIRDATFTLYALMSTGYREEAREWREWLLRAAAGQPSELQIMYGIAGERRLTEYELPWLAGYEGSRPVRVGNAAHDQLQLDVYGELMDVFHAARSFELKGDANAWQLQKAVAEFLEGAWHLPDAGLWEVRGPPRLFTHSRVMAWVAFDRMVKSIEQYGLDGPVDRWRAIRDQIHAEVCAQGFNPRRNSFVQCYGDAEVDAALLLIPQVGFLPASDPRVLGTIAAIEHDLEVDGLVLRYRSRETIDGLPEGEGAFLACSFWLVDALTMTGRRDAAEERFEHLLSLRNDLGLLAEEYDARSRRQLGNFPQAFSHVALVNSAHNLSQAFGPAERRGAD